MKAQLRMAMAKRKRLTVEQLQAKLAGNPSSPAFAQLADEHRRKGRFAEAVRICQDGLTRYPSYVSAYMVLGRAHQEQGDLLAARAAFHHVVEYDPENVLAHRALGEIAEAQQVIPEALASYRMALVLHPFAKEVRAAVSRLEASEGAAAPGAPPGRMEKRAEAAPVVEEPVATETLAVLYAAQGAHERAADIHARLAAEVTERGDRVEPHTEDLAHAQVGADRPGTALRPEEALKHLEAWRHLFQKLKSASTPRPKPKGRLELFEAWRHVFQKLKTKPAPERRGPAELLEAWRTVFQKLKPRQGKGPLEVLQAWRDTFRKLGAAQGRKTG